MTTEPTFSTTDVLAITGTTPGRLRRWRRAGLLLSWLDGGGYPLHVVIAVAQLAILADLRLPLAQIRKVTTANRERINAVATTERDRTLMMFMHYSQQVRAMCELGLDDHRDALSRIAVLVQRSAPLPASARPELSDRIGKLLADILDVPVPARYMN